MRFRALADTSSDGVLLHDDGRIVDANQPFLEMTGYTVDELRRLALLDMVAVEDRDLAARHIASGSTESYEIRGLRKDGSSVPLAVRASDLEHDGRRGRVVWVRDLSERQRVLGALERSEERYRQLFETCPDAIYLADLEGRFEAVNPAMVTLFEFPSAEALIATDPKTLYSQSGDRAGFLAELHEQGAVRGFSLVVVTRGGRRLELRETANLVRGDDGQVAGFQGILRDVTETRRLEQLLAQGQKMEAIGRLAGGVAHDFNNVLTAITGFAELALAGLDSELAAAGDLREILDAAQRARRLTAQLLDFSRQEVQEPQRIDLNAVVGNLGHFLARTLRSDIEILFDLEPGLPPVLADPVQIEQILMNLAINARAAMPSGGRLEIVTRSERVGPLERIQGVALVPGDYSVLIMRDNGIGMDESVRSRAFEPFFSTRNPSKGTGLGLATVYSIVKRSQGYVWIDSAPGQGATFTIFLPQAEGEVAEAAARPAAEASRRALGSEVLLLVEDDDGVREFSRRCLEGTGCEVLAAVNAAEARDILRSEGHRIDLVVTDIVMPGGDGVSLAREVRQRHPEIAILLVSGYPDRALSPEGGEADDFPLLAKPFGADDLIAEVRRQLDARAGRRSEPRRRR